MDCTPGIRKFRLEQSDAIFKGGLLAGFVIKAPPGVLFFPVVEKTRGNLMAAYELGRGAHPTEQLFDNLVFKVDAELSSVLHGKILPPVLRDVRSCRLP